MSPNQNAQREPVIGVALHYTGGSFAGSVAWCRDPKSKVSYHVIIGPTAGQRTVLVPLDKRAWHMGVCRSSDPARLPYNDANSAFIGIAAATGKNPVPATAWQFDAIVAECRHVFQHFGWPLTETWRIVGHASEAVYPEGHRLAGQYGRKPDPEGPNPQAPILSVAAVRAALAG